MSIVKGPELAQNRRERLEELVERYQEKVVRMCFLYLRDRTMAEDAAQETFLKAYRATATPSGRITGRTIPGMRRTRSRWSRRRQKSEQTMANPPVLRGRRALRILTEGRFSVIMGAERPGGK